MPINYLKRCKEMTERSHHYYLNEDHTYRPCTLLEWSNQLQVMNSNGTKHVADDDVKGYRVSTVWLGLDHNHFGLLDEGRPHVFETMVFKKGDSIDLFTRRYTTWEEAEKGHSIIYDLILNDCTNIKKIE